MGMESVYKLSVILNLVDNLSGQMNSVQSSVSGSVDKLNSAFGTMQKAGVAMAGIGGTITGLAMKTVTATFDTQNALGELSSLGVKDLKAVEDAAKSFSNTWAGTSKADFITASYDIKSGIASLTDEGVAQFTQLAALTGKATKSTTEEMGSLFATGYGIYKGFYDDMSDLEFGEMFSAGIATAVKNYKTSGSEMASAISALGATATNANVPLEEQLAMIARPLLEFTRLYTTIKERMIKITPMVNVDWCGVPVIPFAPLTISSPSVSMFNAVASLMEK